MNKEHLQNTVCLKNIVFPSCGVFAIKGGQPRRKESLFRTVELPCFRLNFMVNAYSIPYNWLSDKKVSKLGAGVQQISAHEMSMSNYWQKNIFQVVSNCSLYPLMISKVVENASNIKLPKNDKCKYIFEKQSDEKSPRVNLENSSDAAVYRSDSGVVSEIITSGKLDKFNFRIDPIEEHVRNRDKGLTRRAIFGKMKKLFFTKIFLYK